MSERYIRLYTMSAEDVVKTETCPINFCAGAILKDTFNGNVITQLKFKNTVHKSVRQVRISIQSFDSTSTPMCGVFDFTYNNIGAAPLSEFGSNIPILMQDNNTAKIIVTIQCVAFSDGTHWTPFEEQATKVMKQAANLKEQAVGLISRSEKVLTFLIHISGMLMFLMLLFTLIPPYKDLVNSTVPSYICILKMILGVICAVAALLQSFDRPKFDAASHKVLMIRIGILAISLLLGIGVVAA